MWFRLFLKYTINYCFPVVYYLISLEYLQMGKLIMNYLTGSSTVIAKLSKEQRPELQSDQTKTAVITLD